MDSHTLIQALIYLGSAALIVPIAVRLGLGSVLGYLIAGCIIGPWGLRLVTDAEAILHFAEIGVVLMLVVIGLELDPQRLWKLRASVFGGGALQMVVCGVLIGLFCMLLGMRWQVAELIGMTLALSSTAIAMQAMNERNLTVSQMGRSAFAVLLFQDIAAIPLVAMIPLLAASGGSTTLAAFALSALKVAGALVLVVALGRHVAQTQPFGERQRWLVQHLTSGNIRARVLIVEALLTGQVISGGGNRQVAGFLMPFRGDFRFSEEFQEFRHPGVSLFIFTLHHPQAGPADNGVLRRALHVGVVRHHPHAVVELRVLANIGQRTGRGGGYRAVPVIELLGGLIFTPEVAEIALLVHRFQHGDMLDLLRLVELQNRIGTVKAVVFGRHRQAMPGAEVFNLNPALPAAGVTALHPGGFQLIGIGRQLLPGFRRLLRV